MKASELKASAIEAFLRLWHRNSVGSSSANSVHSVFSRYLAFIWVAREGSKFPGGLSSWWGSRNVAFTYLFNNKL